MYDREQLRENLFSDKFESHWCVSCGGTGALYAIGPGEYYGACSKCLVDRIDRLKSGPEQLPDWVLNLESEARREIAYQLRKRGDEFGADLGHFYRCHRCDKILHEKDARYPIPFEGYAGEIFAHCVDCYGSLTRGS